MSPPSIALSIVRWTRIGIASESPVKTSAHESPISDQAPLGPPERVEVAQRRPELQIGWIDVLHARVGLLAAGPVGHAVGGTRAVAPASMASDTPPGAGLRGGRAVHSTSSVGRDISVTSNLHLTDIIMMSYTGHMDIERHIQAIQSDLAAAAALGDEAIAAAGERLAAAVGVVAPAPPPRRPHGRLAGPQRPAPVRARRGAARRGGTRISSSSTIARPTTSRCRHRATTSAPASPSACRRRSRSRSRSSRAAKASRPTRGSCERSPAPSSRGEAGHQSGRRLQGFTQS